MSQYDREGWWRGSDAVQHPLSLAANWRKIERHPRLVFAKIGKREAAMVRYYLARGRPFTVVVG